MSEQKLKEIIRDLLPLLEGIPAGDWVLIGGYATALLTEGADALDGAEFGWFGRTTGDIDLLVRTRRQKEMILAEAHGSPVHVICIDGMEDSVLFDRELFEGVLDSTREAGDKKLNGIFLPGPAHLIRSKLNRSGIGRRESARGRDMADIVTILLKLDRSSLQSSFDSLAETAVSVVSELKQLFRHDASPGSIALADECDLDPSSMDFILLKAEIDRTLAELTERAEA